MTTLPTRQDRNRVPDAVQRLFGGAPQSRDPDAFVDDWTPDLQRTAKALRCVRGTLA
jgi:hypothetical protein